MGYRKARTSKVRGGVNSRLTAESREQMVKLARAGAPMYLCAQSVGIPERTLSYWMRRGFEEEERLAEEAENLDEGGEPGIPTPDPVEEQYLDLYREMVKARADGGIRSLAAIRKAELGGQVIKETTRKYRDAEGNLVTETEVTRTAPDWRAAAWYLERTHRPAFGKDNDPTRVEIIGVDTQTSAEGQLSTRKAEDLATRVLENIASLSAAAAVTRQITAGPAADVVDVEIVED